MKQSDLFSIIFVGGVGVLISFFACSALMGDPDKAEVKFTALANVVTSDLANPNPEVFNSRAINPTIEIYVGDCEDLDQNGILDDKELVACHRIESSKDEENSEEQESEEDAEENGESNNSGSNQPSTSTSANGVTGTGNTNVESATSQVGR